jgi:hypothetical protein
LEIREKFYLVKPTGYEIEHKNRQDFSPFFVVQQSWNFVLLDIFITNIQSGKQVFRQYYFDFLRRQSNQREQNLPT